MKKKIALTLTAVALLLGGLFYFNQEPENITGVSVSSAFADYRKVSSIEELEKTTDLIISARFTGKRDILNTTRSDGPPHFISRSQVKITHVFWGDAEKGDVLTVSEDAHIRDGVYSGFVGYKWMNESDHYLLFLNSIPDDFGNYYVIDGAYQGKFDYNVTEVYTEVLTDQKSLIDAFYDNNYEYLGDELERFNKLKQEAITKYPEQY